MTGGQQWVAPIFPPGVDRATRLRPLYHSAVWDARKGVDVRRAIARDPLLFALLYLSPYLTDERTGAISLSAMHLDICARVARWGEVGEDRSAWASHRSAGKTFWWLQAVPTWALAMGYRRYFLALAHTTDQAKGHLGNLKATIEQGEGWLLNDFPHLRPARPWTVTDAATKGGQRMTAAGLDKTILGKRHREQRPDLIVGDDLEPGPADWTPASKAKTLGRLLNDVLPAGSRDAAVALVGTPVGMGSVMHDVVRATRGRPGALPDHGGWVRSARFAPHWYPAIVDEHTAAERSAWPTRWPLAELRADRAADARTFALQMQCDPDDPAAQQWWTEGEYPDGTFRYDTRFTGDYRILSIDGAVTATRTSDHTALVLAAVSPDGRRVCIEHASAGSWSRVELRERIWQIAERYPTTLRTLIVETNHGGDMWAESLTPPPPGVSLEPYRVGVDSKRHRAESLFDDYARGAVWHAGRLTALEGQMTTWKPGKGGHGVDDLIDACGAAVRRALYGDASRAPTRANSRRSA